MAHGPDVRCFRPVVVSRYRRPRSHEHSGRQAKVAASSLHTFTPGGSPLFRLRASGTTRGITPPGPGDGVTIFGNGSNHGPTQPVLTAAAPAPHQGRCARRVRRIDPPRQGPPEHAPRPPPGARPRHRGGNDVTAVCQVPSTEIPPRDPRSLGTHGTGDPRLQSGRAAGLSRRRPRAAEKSSTDRRACS